MKKKSKQLKSFLHEIHVNVHIESISPSTAYAEQDVAREEKEQKLFLLNQF